ncbi:MAG: hypothetical protein Tsb0020_22100 [Haliangiales bacterium]
MRSLIFTTLQCAAVALGLSCATVDDFSDDLNRIAESLGGDSTSSRPPSSDCVENQTRCLGTSLQGRRGGRSGHSWCQDCYQECIAQGGWPSKLHGYTCEWWRYE